MTQTIKMEKDLIAVKDIDVFSGFVDLQPTVLVEENGNIYIDLVFAEQKKFIRLALKDGKTERVFKSILTAVNLLSDEGFPEIMIKFNREFAGPEWVHVQKNKDP